MKLNEVLDRLNRVKKTGENQYIACCPAHRDDKPSLSISGSNGKILLHCQAGCDTQRIVEAIGIQMKDLYIQERSGGGWELLRDHLYHDEAGSVIAKKELYLKPDGSKTGVWLRLRNGKYEKGLKGLNIPLYNLPALIDSTGTVYITEGEKDAETLKRMGFVATSAPNGAGSRWKSNVFNKYFVDKDAVILTDNDEPGRLHGEDIKSSLISVAKSVKLIPATAIWPETPHKGDISDIVARFGLDTAKEMLAAAVDAATDEAKTNQESYTTLPGGYALKDGCLYQDIAHSENSDARQELKYLLNGWVEAVGEVTHDNGIDVDRVLKLNFHCCNGKEIQAETSFKDLQNGQFLTMFGMDARPAVGTTKKAYIADSILGQSDTAIRQTVYTQTGWRKIDGKWCFLHGGGAIGAEGVTVELSGRNTQYQFPNSESPGRYETLQRFFTVAPESITYPLDRIVQALVRIAGYGESKCL